MPKTQSIVIDLIQLDADTQSRMTINEDTVQEYFELIESVEKTEWPFDKPCELFHDGNTYFPSDGFHRILAAVRAKRCTVPCVVHKGTARDARIHGMRANDKHGLRPTRADKRKNVLWWLDQPGRMSQTAIAEAVGCSRQFVAKIMLDKKETEKPPERDGGSVNNNIPTVQVGGDFESEPQPDRGGGESQGQVENEEDKSGDCCPSCGNSEYDKYEDGFYCPACRGEGNPDDEDSNESNASVVLDSLDRPIPEQFQEHHDMAGGIATQARRLDPILRELMEFAEQPGGEWLSRSSLQTEIKAIKGKILGACYAFECPRCKGEVGKKCTACKGRGWWPLEKKNKLSNADKQYLGVE